MEQSKPLEEIDVWEHPPKSGIVLSEERNKKFFEENQTDSLLRTLFKISEHGMMRKSKNNSGLLQEISFVAIEEPRVKLYMPIEESHLLPMNYIDVTRTTQTSLDVLSEKILMITRTWIEKELPDAWTGSRKIYFVEWKATCRINMVQRRLRRGNRQLRDPTVYGQICGSICLMQRNTKRRKSGLSRNQCSRMPDNYVVSSFWTRWWRI